jgi:PTS system mannose-specific IIB component
MAKQIAVRVDDRLIHGQVVTQWVKVFNAQKIVVIDNNVAKDKMQKNVLKFAAPPELKVSIFSVDKAVEIWKKQFGNLMYSFSFKMLSNKELADKGVSSTRSTL